MAKIKAPEEYMMFTTPAELHKAINTLRGIIAGISSSDGVSESEMQELVHWCTIHDQLKDRHPFSELLPAIETSLQDGVINEEEQSNILWLCNNFVDSAKYYDVQTSSIQFLHGLVHGLMADGELSDREVQSLKFWLDSNEFLSGSYPYDELYSIIHSIMEDKIITADERDSLIAFLSSIIDFKSSLNLAEPDYADLRKKYSISGVCAFCPEIEFQGKLFCFTGESYRATRSEIKDEVERLGGTFRTSVSKKTDYLVVGSAGNPCWAYSCYGRKIEEAVNLRKEGAHIQIINETDFWDAVWDSELD